MLELEEAPYRQYVAKRRIASFGFEYDFSSRAVRSAAALPDFLFPLRQKAARWAGVAPSAFAHGLVTEYRPGTQLGWHRDTPEFGLVVGVSLAGAARMRLRPWPARKGGKAVVLDLPPRSAYLLRDEARWKWQHAISATPALRYSVTLRTLRAGVQG